MSTARIFGKESVAIDARSHTEHQVEDVFETKFLNDYRQVVLGCLSKLRAEIGSVVPLLSAQVAQMTCPIFLDCGLKQTLRMRAHALRKLKMPLVLLLK